MESERQQGFGFARGQRSPTWWRVTASILAIAWILPGRASAEPSPDGRARGTAARKALAGGLTPSGDAKLTLRVYDYAPVDPEVLDRAEKVAAAIFEETGIEIAWMDCTPPRGEPLPRETCPSDMGATDLVLRLFPRRMAMKVATPNEPLGFAQECPESEPACELTVFYFRVEELAADGHWAEKILGHVIAHEVAHVLIGPGHSEDGIMRREWSREELRRMLLGLQLGFSNEQSRRLHEAALRRVKQPILETSTRTDLAAAKPKAGE